SASFSTPVHRNRVEESIMPELPTLDPTRLTRLALGTLLSSLALSSLPAMAAMEVWRETHKYCEKQPDGSANPCGAVAYANGGGYNVARVYVESRDNEWDSNPACEGVSMSDAN